MIDYSANLDVFWNRQLNRKNRVSFGHPIGN